LHATVRRALRQAWELDDADKAEKLIRNLAKRLEGTLLLCRCRRLFGYGRRF
jgi:hypothetical protein